MEDAEIETYTTGDSFIEYAEKLHIMSENGNKDRPLKFVISYVFKASGPNVVME